MNDFHEDLKFSHDQSKLPIWDLIYNLAFPTFKTMEEIEQDGWAQRAGIDRLVILESGKIIYIDEKVRRKDYDDILIEYWSDEERKKPGWIAKDSACDYIAYAFLPSKRCYLLPFQQLRKAWKENMTDWVSKYRRVEAQNNGYVTVSVAVPIEILMADIQKAMVVDYRGDLQ